MDSKNDGITSVIKGMFSETEELPTYDSASDHLPQGTDVMVGTSTSRELDVRETPPFEAVDATLRTSLESHDMTLSRSSMGSSLPEPTSLDRFGSTLNLTAELWPTMQCEPVVGQMCANEEAVELRRHYEPHQYLEHIDSLQAKLQYTTREATNYSKKTKSEGKASSVEQKLAIKDEKTVLPMSEGQELAQNELKHMNTIKKLRTRVMEDGENMSETQRIIAELEKPKMSVAEYANEAEDSGRDNFHQQNTFQEKEVQLEKAILKNDRRAIENAKMQQQLPNLQSARGANEVIELKNLLEEQRKIIVELRDDFSNAKLERELSDERHRGHIRKLQGKLDRANEKAKVTEVELRGELGVSDTENACELL